MTTYEILAIILTFATVLAGAVTVVWKCAVFYHSAMETKKHYEEERQARKNDQEQIAKLLHEAEERRAIIIWRGMLIIKHDPPPQIPICPGCYSNGRIIRMKGRSKTISKSALRAIRRQKEAGLDPEPIIMAATTYEGFVCPVCESETIMEPEYTDAYMKWQIRIGAPTR